MWLQCKGQVLRPELPLLSNQKRKKTATLEATLGCWWRGEVAAQEVPGAAFSILGLWQGPNRVSRARQACDRGSPVSPGTQDGCPGD